MTLEHFIYFLEICNTGTISEAAENLHISPQALSKAMKALEKEIDCELFTRSKSGVTLTDTGKSLKTSAEKILDEYHHFLAGITLSTASRQSNARSHISILSTSTCFPLLNKLYRNLKPIYPNVTLTSAAVAPMLTQLPDNFNLFDVSILCIPSNFEVLNPLKETHDIYLLDQGNLRLFLSEHSELAKKQTISNSALASIPIADYGITEEDSELIELLKMRGIKPNIGIRTNTPIQFAESFVPEDYYFLGTNFFVNTFLGNTPKNLASVPLRTKISLSYILTVKKSSLEHDPINEYFKIVKNHFKRNIIKM